MDPRVEGGRALAQTPNKLQKELYKYYCPICMMYFISMSKTDCCSNYICEYCYDDLAVSAKKEIHCPFCDVAPLALSSVSVDDKLKTYVDTLSAPEVGHLKFRSPARVGDSFEELRRKMLTFEDEAALMKKKQEALEQARRSEDTITTQEAIFTKRASSAPLVSSVGQISIEEILHDLNQTVPSKECNSTRGTTKNSMSLSQATSHDSFNLNHLRFGYKNILYESKANQEVKPPRRPTSAPSILHRYPFSRKAKIVPLKLADILDEETADSGASFSLHKMETARKSRSNVSTHLSKMLESLFVSCFCSSDGDIHGTAR